MTETGLPIELKILTILPFPETVCHFYSHSLDSDFHSEVAAGARWVGRKQGSGTC